MQEPISGQKPLTATNVFYTMFLAVACIHIWETLRRQTRRSQLLVLGAFSAGIAALLILVRRPWPRMVLALACLACALLVCRLLAKRMDKCAVPDGLSNILAALRTALACDLSHPCRKREDKSAFSRYYEKRKRKEEPTWNG